MTNLARFRYSETDYIVVLCHAPLTGIRSLFCEDDFPPVVVPGPPRPWIRCLRALNLKCLLLRMAPVLSNHPVVLPVPEVSPGEFPSAVEMVLEEFHPVPAAVDVEMGALMVAAPTDVGGVNIVKAVPCAVDLHSSIPVAGVVAAASESSRSTRRSVESSALNIEVPRPTCRKRMHGFGPGRGVLL